MAGERVGSIADIIEPLRGRALAMVQGKVSRRLLLLMRSIALAIRVRLIVVELAQSWLFPETGNSEGIVVFLESGDSP